MSKQMITVKIGRDEIGTHIPFFTNWSATLCGIPKNDPSYDIALATVPIEPREKITCRDCFERFAVATGYTLEDFYTKPPRLGRN